MAITKILARIPFLGPQGNKILVAADKGSPPAFGPIFPKFTGNWTKDPIWEDHSSFPIEYDAKDPSKDKIVIRMAIELLPIAPFIGEAGLGYMTIDAATLNPHFEQRDWSTPESFGQTDLPISGGFFGDSIENPEVTFNRNSFFSELPVLGVDGQVVYQAGWNKNYVTHPNPDGFGQRTYQMNGMVKDGLTDDTRVFESNDLVIPRFYDWVFFLGIGTPHRAIVATRGGLFFICKKTGNTAASGRPEYAVEEQVSSPTNDIRMLSFSDGRTLVGLSRGRRDGPKTVFIWDFQTRRFTLSQLFLPDVDANDPLTTDAFYQTSLTITGYDQRRARLISMTGYPVINTETFASTFPNFVGNSVTLWNLLVTPQSIMEPIPRDTFRTGKTTVVYTKVIGSAGELIGSYRVGANITDPVRGRLKTAEGTTNGRAQANFSYVAPSLPADAGAVPAIKVETNDVPGTF